MIETCYAGSYWLARSESVEWRRSSGSAAFRSRGTRSLVRRGDQASAGRISIDVDDSSWFPAPPPDARLGAWGINFRSAARLLNTRVPHSLLRAASRTGHDHRRKLQRSLERGIRSRASSRSPRSKSRVIGRSFPPSGPRHVAAHPEPTGYSHDGRPLHVTKTVQCEVLHEGCPWPDWPLAH
jgi:hypothetical protein